MATLTLNRPVELPPKVAEAIASKQAEAVEAERKARRAENQVLRRRLYALLRDLGVTVFDRFTPLKIGINQDIVALLAGEATPQEVGHLLRWHVRQLPYLQALAAGEPRRELDGTETGIPSDNDRAGAVAAVADIIERRAANRGAVMNLGLFPDDQLVAEQRVLDVAKRIQKERRKREEEERKERNRQGLLLCPHHPIYNSGGPRHPQI